MPKVWADRTPGTGEAPMNFSRPCLGCGKLIRRASRCPACEATAYAATVLRPTGSRAAWTAIRNAVLAAEPLCRLCGARAVTVDHLIPRIRGGDDSMSNLRPLCHQCHTAPPKLKTHFQFAGEGHATSWKGGTSGTLSKNAPAMDRSRSIVSYTPSIIHNTGEK